MGYFEVCHKGTLFLDELSDMPLNLQAKLLRVTEDKFITRIGDTQPIFTDFRLISATNQDIERLVMKRKFRLDLLHRLNILHIHIPPLRERPEDIKPLLEHFTNVFATKYYKHNIRIADEVFQALYEYDFPGNVRELRNMTERALILHKGDVLNVSDFPVKEMKAYERKQQKNVVDLKSAEIDLLKNALKSSNFNQTAAAEILGITRDALIRKMKKFNINIKKIQN